MEFGVLGPVEVWQGGRPFAAGHARQRAVLAVLLLELGRVVPAATLIDRVWGEQPPASVRNVLYGYLGRLRAIIVGAADPDVTLVRRPGGYLLQAAPERLDACRFRRLATQATAAAGDDAGAAGLLRESLGLWRGPALAGLDSPWLNRMRDALEAERVAAVLDLNDIRMRQGEHGALASELAGQAAACPDDERLAGQLMLALYRCGRQAEALRWFDRTRRHLADELGADPGPSLRAVHQQILRADPALASPAPAPSRRPGQAGGPAPRQLPTDVAAFTGRAAEIAELDRLLTGRAAGDGTASAGQPAAAVILAVSGTAGVGKTALAVHWAHRVVGRFGDGQLYVNLRGFDHSGTPVTTAGAIRGFLDSLGFPSDHVPSGPEAQASLYRSLLADRKMLVVLDNARDEAQVRPLLPASPGSLVIVTSRSQLGGLAAAEGARLLILDVLTRAEAAQLLTARLGRRRAAAEPGAVDQIVDLCACLPLALAIASARAAARPSFPLAALAAELVDAADRLDALDAGDPGSSVRAIFSWSFQQLSAESARMFCLLGVHPGPDISLRAAASLVGRAQRQARRLLQELARAHLVTEHLPGRYAFHDLLRAYATEQARDTGSQADRDAAAGRMLDHYLHTAARATLLLHPSRDPITLPQPRPGTAPEQPADHAQALAWFEAEHQVLLAAVTVAAGSGFDIHAWQLPWAVATFLRLRGHWREGAATAHTALAAATRLGDTAAQAESSRFLAMACTDLGDHDQARGHFASCLMLYQQLGNSFGEARVHQNLGVLAERQGRYADALGHAEQALCLYQAIGDKTSEPAALNSVGWCHGLLGDYQQARAFCQQALNLNAEVGDRWFGGYAWDSIGYAEHHLGNLTEAAACYQRALTLFREADDRIREADTLTHLGDTRHAAGQLAQAQEAWHQALAIFDELQHADADQVRVKLASTNGHASPNLSA